MDRKAGLRHWPFYLALTGGLLSLPIGFAFFRAEAIEVAAILFSLSICRSRLCGFPN